MAERTFEDFDREHDETTAHERLVDALEKHGSREDPDAEGMWNCPAHEDPVPSLHVTAAADRVLVHCFAGCTPEAVTAAVGLGIGNLFNDRYAYHYKDLDGRTVKTKHRERGKAFRQSGATTTYALYRLPEVWRAVEEGRTVWLVEGEKDVHTLELEGEVATTTGAVDTLAKADLSPLHGATVRVVIDRDAAGDKWARAVLAALDGRAEVSFFEAAHGKDVTDHLLCGGTLADLTPMTPAAPSPFERMVEERAQRLRADREARAALAAEAAEDVALPEFVGLRDLLAEPDEDAAYRVQDVWPEGGRVLLAAAHKAGKTTLTGNLLRSLADGDPFLGAYFVRQAGRVALVDDEMSEGQTRRWLRDQGIANADRVRVVNLRGRVATFDLTDPTVRARWADRVRGADVLVLDCLRPVLDALGLSEDKEAGRFLVALDALAAEAGVSEVLLVHHMGHANERSRGDSRLLDWPDAVWKIVRQDAEDPTSPRFFSAYGRDVDVPETMLDYDPDTRHLTLGTGSRRDARLDQHRDAVRAVVRGNPGVVTRAIKDGVHGNAEEVGRTVGRMVADGELVRVPGRRGAFHHYLPGDEPSGSSESD